jgi:phosphoribosylformylglycinamidine cyclo-ligase
MSHITGGGIEGNTYRIVPKNLKLKIDWQSWKQPTIFQLIQKLGKVADVEMRRVFNLGIGFIFIVDGKYGETAIEILKKNDEQSFIIGEVI